jgi:cobalt/nickel transport system ATP-binding protein
MGREAVILLNVRNLSVVYPDKTKAVGGVNFSIDDGESIALIGANGDGKTSLLLSLVGVIPSEGDIIVDNIHLDRHTAGEIRRRIGVVFQNPDDQLFMPSIYEDIAFGLRNCGMKENEVNCRALEVLRRLHIDSLIHKSALRLSGGEKRMAAIATVLVMEPAVMLFDEPTAFLDPKAKRNLIETLNALPHTKLIATHDLAFASEACKRVILIKNGEIFADGNAGEMLYDKKRMDDCGVEALRRWKE